MKYAIFPLTAIHADNCGNAILSPGWKHPERRLPSSVLILGKRGSAVVVDEGEELEIRPSRITLLAAGRHHRGARPIEASASYFWMHFTAADGGPALLSPAETDAMLSNEDIMSHKLGEAALVPQSFDLKDEEPFVQYFHDLFYEQESPSYTAMKYQIVFQEMLIRLTECVIAAHRSSGASDSSLASIVYAIISAVLENLNDSDLSVKTIALALSHNPDYLGRRFREVMGISIGTFILRKRMQLARSLLQNSNDSVKEIAAQCGFGSARHFMRQFKGEAGMTPSELRLHHQARHINNQ
jgi:AraC-like DNA-binding protein